MEFGLHEEFPIYAGGLGILAGDFLKAARDLGLPVVGVGLRWARGYSRQRIGADGTPVDEFPEYSAECLTDTGARVRVRVAEREVEVRVWRTERWGNAPLLLLEPVAEEDRWITHRLYEPSLDRRVAQEILLGVGGVRALAALGLDVDTYHFNEGHAVFAGIAMIAERTAAGTAFREAWDAVRARIVFTTHTPIPAGNEVHPLGELGRLGACCGLGEAEMRALGGDPFNMTVAGLRLSRRANAVSELHGEVSRAMWRDVEGASEILAVTNGVHVPTWQDPRIRAARGAADGPRAAPDARRGRLAQQPAPPARGLRDLGHEGRPERRPQLLRARRLVARGLPPRRERLGDRRRHRHRPGPRAGRPLRQARARGPARLGRPRALAGHDGGEHRGRGGAVLGGADGARVR